MSTPQSAFRSLRSLAMRASSAATPTAAAGCSALDGQPSTGHLHYYPFTHTAQVPAAADAGLRALPRAAPLVADLRPKRRANPGNHSAAAAAAGARDGDSMTTQGPQAHEQRGPWVASCAVKKSWPAGTASRPGSVRMLCCGCTWKTTINTWGGPDVKRQEDCLGEALICTLCRSPQVSTTLHCSPEVHW
jgi:hypothetical protein